MAFNIKLGNFTNQKNALGKSVTWGSIGSGGTISGTLKNETSIIDPVILIEADLIDVKDYNYMSIAAFNRVYFITNIKQIRSHLVEISAHVDVLSSFRGEIMKQKGIADRRENRFNTYLNDGSIHVYQDRYVINYPLAGDFDNKTGSYILALAGS